MTRYFQCRTCGKYVGSAGMIGRALCSEECARGYSMCMNCGRAFPRGKGFDEDHCNRDCAVKYRIMRKYGPEPVTVVTEV